MKPGSSSRGSIAMTDQFALADRLHSVAIHLLRRVRRVDEATGLTAAKLSALSVVVFGGPLSLRALADAEQVRPPSITRTVRELEADGLVGREPDEADRRVVNIHATAKGKRLLQQGRSARIGLLAEWLRGLDREQLGVLEEASALLERVLAVPRRVD
jgi:DNA-binding MarR family transcriptional regulator